VQFTDSDGRLSALIACGSEEGAKVVPAELPLNLRAERVREVAYQLLTLTSGEVPWREAADALDVILEAAGAEILAPIAEVLAEAGARYVLLCPTNALMAIPLHAATVGGRPFMDQFAVSYAPSAAVIRQLVSRPSETSDLDLIVACTGTNAPCGVRLDPISGPEEEAHVLRALAPRARLLAETEATADEILAAIAESRVAHIAAHGAADLDQFASGLFVTGSTLATALLSAARVQAGPALRTTSLVVLSACETARHPTVRRAVEAWRGLDSAFMSRGVAAVVANLWEVGDLACLIYSTVLHAHLSQGNTIAHAHAAAAGVLRGASPSSLAARLLDDVRPTWRAEAHAYGLRRAYRWSAFRASGVCWQS
jgi:CHAT domain-containing protein